jgi:cell wall-associated NlpC family hydrolase
MRRIHTIAAFLMIGAITFAGRAAIAEAAEEPVAGISIVLDEFYQNAGDTDEKAVKTLLASIDSEYKDLAFAQVTNYVNIRSKASEEGEILGKLYNNSAATVISKEDDWYKIRSGSVTGYIKGEFLITGADAEKLAESVGTRIATVNTTTLKVRAKAAADAEVLTLVAEGDDYQVAKEQEDWVKIKLDENSYGYVSTDYVRLETVYEEAVSIEEEQERLAEEAEADRESASGSGSSNSGTAVKSATYYATEKESTSSESSSSLGEAIVDFAVQYVGNPYVWGGTSLTSGADCSGFTQSVFEHFNISIPRTSRTQATSGRRVSLDSLRPGDLVFYARSGTINHVAIYIGGGRVISASSPSTGIRITSLYYRTPYKAARYTN